MSQQDDIEVQEVASPVRTNQTSCQHDSGLKEDIKDDDDSGASSICDFGADDDYVPDNYDELKPSKKCLSMKEKNQL
jgi:hypothetical protein